MYLMKKTLINRRYRGLAVVEAAIVFPLLLMITLGAIEYGWLFLKAHQLANAARSGARVAVCRDSSPAEGEAVMWKLLTEDAKITPDVCTVTVVPLADGSTAMKAEVKVASAKVALINTSLLPMPATLGASVTMAKEGP